MAFTFATLMMLWSALASATDMQIPLDDEISWEDFDAAVQEDDCFGHHCQGASGALSLMQVTAKVKSSVKSSTRKEPTATQGLDQEPTAAQGIDIDELNEAFESEDEARDNAEVAALSLVQTGATMERASVEPIHASVAGAVNADGTIDINPKAAVVPASGIMHFSVDVNGGLHNEDEVVLMQTKADVTKRSITADSNLKVRKPAEPSDEVASSDNTLASSDNTLKVRKSAQGELAQSSEVKPTDLDANEELEGTSLVQTDVSVEAESPPSIHKTMLVSANADGSLEMNPTKTVVPDNGVMQFSVDQFGNFHAEEGLSLIQKKATKPKKTLVDKARPSHPEQSVTPVSSVSDHPSWSLEAVSEDDFAEAALSDSVEALSLIQTDAHIERKSTIKTKPPKDGQMTLSVDSHGVFHKGI